MIGTLRRLNVLYWENNPLSWNLCPSMERTAKGDPDILYVSLGMPDFSMR
jgi:hypothetical protein